MKQENTNMKMLRIILVICLCVLAMSTGAKADSDPPVLTLDPTDGALTGPAGSTVGWGFTLTSGGSDFAVISGSDFCVGAVASPCSNSFGTYTDFAGPQYIVVGNNPGESPVTETFDNSAQTGMGSFAINPTSTGTISGDIVVSYDLYSVDPNSSAFNPELDTISNGDMLFAPASVTVGSSTGTNGSGTVPEPETFPLLLAGFAALVLAGVKSGKNLRTDS
jgi:hypothetical protein